MRLFLIIIFIAFNLLTHAQEITGKVVDKRNLPLQNVQVALVNTTAVTYTNASGNYLLSAPDTGLFEINFAHPDIGSYSETILIKAIGNRFNVTLIQETKELDEVTIENERTGALTQNRLKHIEGTAIYAGKKSDLILVSSTCGNKATDNARQLFAKVPGLNIWESDNAGLQLGIGVRGLSPNRTSNFNTRQNGYDIAADALGYPESYYTPPSNAIERIEVIRGAASLQYGSQFGGMLNFKLNGAPEDEKFDLKLRNSAGSFGLWNNFNSIGGRLGKLHYYAYTQIKRGNGWRKNSTFSREDAHIALAYDLSKKLRVQTEFTHMRYLAQQGGGLTDRMFEQNPRMAIRARNWFAVRWNVGSLAINYKPSPFTEINSKTFALHGKRLALGYLGTANSTDPMGNRDLLSDEYNNLGHETRLIHRYKLGKEFAAFATGVRFYQGNTVKQQGDADDGFGANFSYLNPDNLERSDFVFPSQNVAFFAENILHINHRLVITPGLRYEWIKTQGQGIFREIRTNLAGDTLLDKSTFSELERSRDFLLFGIGAEYHLTEHIELYGNISQNYRAINFNDMKIVNPNFKVDPNLEDERGFNIDFGARGRVKQLLNFDLSAFMLSYQNKIGEVLQEDPDMFRVYRLRTNISDAITYGLETFAEIDLLQIKENENRHGALVLFTNITAMNARYTGSKEQAFYNKRVELVPEFMLRSGITYQYKNFKLNAQYNYTSQQFTDATNTKSSANAIHGIIPAFGIWDASVAYHKNWFSVSSGINNLSNNMYFTRRAAGYPGPGVIPSDGRNWYLTIGVDL
ncbi:MAG: TonB-dependent receptor domain-containing protein [Bacteroidia bacterium]